MDIRLNDYIRLKKKSSVWQSRVVGAADGHRLSAEMPGLRA